MTVTMEPPTEAAVSVQKLPLTLLRVHPDVQRRFDPANAAAKLPWRPAAAGVLHTIAQPDGTYLVFDGQHRLSVMRGLEIDNAWCMIHHGVNGNVALAAELTGAINNAKPWHIIDRFKTRLQSGEPVAAAIVEILRNEQTDIAWHTGSGYSAVQALEEVYTWGCLPATVRIIEASWPTLPLARTRAILEGVAAFHATFVGVYTFDKLTARLAVTPLTALISSAKGNSSQRRRAVFVEVAEEVRIAYNRGATRRLVGDILTRKQLRKRGAEA